ncbi:unnamed protein product [Thelazia callipaeda]|uniref:Serine/threonine-protein phosphatase n=1 Tax=Thelazia callipaeda TaxID=103827 RepID=A0A0N5CSK2_THECL|nr:unnamed protein product [Thelazia callipaeda]
MAPEKKSPITKSNLMYQKSKHCRALSESDIDKFLIALLVAYRRPVYKLSSYISINSFLSICHTVIDVLKKCSTLEYVHDPRGIGIIGDIHGDFSDLVKCLVDTGLPSTRTVLFLGDYIDRGDYPIEVLLFLFLLKIRYPNCIILLRGNHETQEMCSRYGLKEKVYFFLAVVYPEEEALFLLCLINLIFDHLPLAAIVSDQILCCHAGISQFVDNRCDIASIPRPPFRGGRETTLHQIAILTDLLWSDPMDNQKDEYCPSARNTSFFFNEAALRRSLRNLRCRALIRGHQVSNVCL